MIKKIIHQELKSVHDIYDIFQSAYRIEAALLEIPYSRFPPLLRTIDDIQNTTTEFYGIYVENQLATLCEIELREEWLYFNSVVTHPDHFRKGLAKKLLTHLLHTISRPQYFVETGAGNLPAIRLYEKLGFKEINRWEIEELNVFKIKMEKIF